MKYRLMGIEKTLDDIGVKTRIIGMQDGVMVKYENYYGDKPFTLRELIGIINIKTNIKPENIHIPEHIKNTLKQKE